jgi:type IV pilus assembly protein PilO
MFSNLSNREKVLLTILFIAAISSLYYFYIYQPAVQEITELKSRKSEKENRLNIAITFAKKLPDLKNEYNLLLKNIMARGEYTEKDKIDLLIDFREAIKERELELIRFQPQREDRNYKMQVNIDGDFADLVLLLEDFEKWDYWFEFKQIELKKSNLGVLASMNVNYHDKIFEGGKLYE